MNIQLPRLLVIELVVISTGVIFYFAGNVISRFGEVALIFAFAILLTYALLPIVNLLDRWRYMPRGLAVLLVYLLLFATLAGIVTIVSVPLAKEVEQLAKDYPKYADQFQESIPKLENELQRRGIAIDVREQANELTRRAQETGTDVASKSGSILATIFGTVSTIFFVLFVTLYFLLGGKQLADGVIAVFPKTRQRMVRKLMTDYDRIISSFVRGHLLLSVIIGTVVSLFATIIGLPYAVLIGVFAGITSLVPVIGALLGVAAPILVAAFVHPILIPFIMLFYFILNEISDKLLYPRIVGKALELHPLLVLFAVLIGVKLAGIAGALLATPLLGITKATIIALRKSSGYARV